MEYREFLDVKSQLGGMSGFDPVYTPDFLFDFQKSLVDWSIRKGRSAIFADCGLGKTPMQLVWAQNIVEHTNRPVLILTPLAVSHQTCGEADKFGMEAERSSDGSLPAKIVVTNYERLHYFNPSDFAGVVCDESSILKSFDGVRRQQITDFMRKMEYRLLCTATAAPNDFIELGSSSEALGDLGHVDMLSRFFKNDNGNAISAKRSRRFQKPIEWFGDEGKWRLKGHAEIPFWKWVCSWARACRKPSDLGFDDGRFILPPLIENTIVVKSTVPREGLLFDMAAVGLREQREERRHTIKERCAMVSELAQSINGPVLVWCHMNDEGDTLEKSIPGRVQISGRDDDESKERKFLGFIDGTHRVLVTKPKIGAWGLNFQHCADVITFASHSFEQYYQSIRRCWRFGQTKPVNVHIVTTEGEVEVMANLKRKAESADRMFAALVEHMNDAISIEREADFAEQERIPTWL